jgi:hypothetical protein
MNAMGKQPDNDSFTSTLAKQVMTTQLTPMLGQLSHHDCRKICIVFEVHSEHEPALVASSKVSNQLFE